MLREKLSQIWGNIQYLLLPELEQDIGPLSERHSKLVSILELIRVEQFIPSHRGLIGRPAKDRVFLARAFVAKIVFKLQYTSQLRDYLLSDRHLRLICGWDSVRQVPSESKFSRVFEEFSLSRLPQQVHENLIQEMYKDDVVGHVIKDSTPIEVREKAVKKKKDPPKPKKKLGRPKKGEVREKTLTRIERQASGMLSLEEMLDELPKDCTLGKKKNPSGHHIVWKGYKLHIAVDDHCVPLAAIVTSASLNDNQVAIPLAVQTDRVATNFYDLMDSAYDVQGILDHSKTLNHVPIVDKKPSNPEQKQAKKEENKRRKLLNFAPIEVKRYRERRKGERINALCKDYYGGHRIWYRGHAKVSCHLMFGILALAATLLFELV